jgi:hypothetical protein
MQGTLIKWKARYIRPPCTRYITSTSFDNANIIYFFTKQVSLMRRSTVLSLPTQLVFHAVWWGCLSRGLVDLPM